MARPGPVPLFDRIDATGDCWEWIGTHSDGYGRYKRAGKMVGAHVAIYEALVGPIPEGLEPDHRCENKGCVNPDHLELVTRSVNVLRGRPPNLRKTHCLAGHPYSRENTRVVTRPDGRTYRECRACRSTIAGRAARRRQGKDG